MHRALIAAVVISLAPPVPASVKREIARLRQHHGRPLVYLGTHFRGLTLVGLDLATGVPDAIYADCRLIDVQTFAPNCHRSVEIENEVPAAGEISTQGRCTFSATIRRATVAFFPVNSRTLRVFLRGTTVYISSASRPTILAAARRLRSFDGRIGPSSALPARDVHRALGRSELGRSCTVRRRRRSSATSSR